MAEAKSFPPDALMAGAEQIRSSHRDGQNWFAQFSCAYQALSSQARDAAWSNFVSWLSREIAWRVRPKDSELVQNAMWCLGSATPLSPRDLAFCLDRMRGYGAAAVYVLSQSSGAAASIFAMLAAKSHPQYGKDVLCYAGCAFYCWASDAAYLRFYAEAGQKMLEAMRADPGASA